MKKKRTASIKSLRGKLDKLFNTYIKEKDKKCILTGDAVGLQCSHYYEKKGNPYLRWDERNAHAMANHKGNAVHFKHHHGKEPEYALWMFEHHSLEFMRNLSKDANTKIEYTRDDIIRLTHKYELKLAKLRSKSVKK